MKFTRWAALALFSLTIALLLAACGEAASTPVPPVALASTPLPANVNQITQTTSASTVIAKPSETAIIQTSQAVTSGPTEVAMTATTSAAMIMPTEAATIIPAEVAATATTAVATIKTSEVAMVKTTAIVTTKPAEVAVVKPNATVISQPSLVPTPAAIVKPAEPVLVKPSATAISKPAVLSGNFNNQGAEPVAGRAILGQTADGKNVLRLENLKSANGPDLYVYLTRTGSPAKDSDIKAGLELGKLRATQGNLNYELAGSLDLTQFKSVVVYCKSFSTIFGYANLSTQVS